MLIPGRTLQTFLFFSDRGKVYAEKAFQIPDAGRTDKGIPIINVLALEQGEQITAAVAVPEFESAQYCTMATRKGRIKRVSLAEFASVRPSGLIAIGLEEGDQLGWVRLTHGDDDVILVTEEGQALRMAEKEIRPMGRQASGVNGIHLRPGDQVASLEVVEPGGYLMVITTLGFGKISPLDEYPVKGRATGGVLTIDQKNMDSIGRIAAARVVQEDDEVTSISTGGTVLRQRVKEINPLGRATRGVRLMNMSKGDTVASLARLPAAEIKVVEEDLVVLPAAESKAEDEEPAAPAAE
jgi:DNA gyrase subunit A